MSRMTLLVATGNEGKKAEYRELLRSLHTPLAFPSDLGLHLHVPEDGCTYRDNAIQKASAHCVASGMTALADDSGLEVDALDGAPGVRSARYTPGSDDDRVAALLVALDGVPPDRRTARFRCAVAIVTPWGESHCAVGTCEGIIAQKPTGTRGFGYDPAFYLPELDATMAELAPEAKNKISHRARAVQAALPWLRGILLRADRGED